GTDHGSEKFFHWPIHEGKDLSYGTNYQDASSIFAWHCDQDFFGSYNEDLGRGVVAYANHHQLPGKKAWTWGWGSYGTMHQMDLTDDDGPYNEVQTGPLLTQGEVGRLDPCEAVEWKEWWYPVHAIGGFTFANKDVAVNASRAGARLKLRILGTSHWPRVVVWAQAEGGEQASARCEIRPDRPVEMTLYLASLLEPTRVWIETRGATLAEFSYPLDLPVRQPPEKKDISETAESLAEAGWQNYLFARFPEAETHFRQALEKDPNLVAAHTGLAYLNLERNPEEAMSAAQQALEAKPDEGLAQYALAVAAFRVHEESSPNNYLEKADRRGIPPEEAWEALNDVEARRVALHRTAREAARKASLDTVTAVPARALLARLSQKDDKTIEILSEPGPWQNDPLCRNCLAYALLRSGDEHEAVRLATDNLAIDPLDNYARSLLRNVGNRRDDTTQSLLWLAGYEDGEQLLRESFRANEQGFLQLVAACERYDGIMDVMGLFVAFYEQGVVPQDLMAYYWEPSCIVPSERPVPTHLASFPYLPEGVKVLRNRLDWVPEDGRATLLLGHLLFHLGRHDEGRAMWRKAADLGAKPVIAYRALGMAAKTLDHDLKSARAWLEKANQADPSDCIVARDLANVLFALADQSERSDEKRALTVQAREALSASFEEGKGRSDFIALLARA
ncbi:MAG: DUF5107 domain-containing protein, partial [Candidatus Binatia bacterium]